MVLLHSQRKILVWGSLCKRGHDHSGEGHSLRDPKRGCVDCVRVAKKASRLIKKAKKPAGNDFEKFDSRTRKSGLQDEDSYLWKFRLRPDCEVNVELPLDISQAEACRLAGLIFTTPFSYSEEEIFENLYKMYGKRLINKLMRLEGYEKGWLKKKAA